MVDSAGFSGAFSVCRHMRIQHPPEGVCWLMRIWINLHRNREEHMLMCGVDDYNTSCRDGDHTPDYALLSDGQPLPDSMQQRTLRRRSMC